VSAVKFDEERLSHLKQVISEDVEARRYFGAVIQVARGGEFGLDAAIGHADGDRKRPLATNSVFSIFSVTKAITNVLVLRSIELGRMALTTRISDIVTEFTGVLVIKLRFSTS